MDLKNSSLIKLLSESLSFVTERADKLIETSKCRLESGAVHRASNGYDSISCDKVSLEFGGKGRGPIIIAKKLAEEASEKANVARSGSQGGRGYRPPIFLVDDNIANNMGEGECSANLIHRRMLIS